MIFTIIVAVLAIGTLIFFHELGHFITAKKIGVRVERFSLGFGPKIVSFKKGETEYLVSSIPFGGYVKLAGESLSTAKGRPDEFCSRSVRERMFIIAAGSLFNFLLAFLLFFLVFKIGVSTINFDSTAIGRVSSGYSAQDSGLMAGDEIVSIDGKKVFSWPEVQQAISGAGNAFINIEVLREQKRLNFQVKGRWDKEFKRRLIGISPLESIKKYSFFAAIKEGFLHLGVLTSAIINGLFLFITGQVKADVAGPLGIVQMIGAQAKEGLTPLLYFVAFISINLGILNLLPIPVLDGGLLLFLGIEGIRKKPISEKKRHLVEQIGLAFLITLILFATMRDFIRLIPH